MDLECSRQIFERYQVPNFMKPHSLGAELFHADGRKDGQTDMTKVVVFIRNFADEHKICDTRSTLYKTDSVVACVCGVIYCWTRNKKTNHRLVVFLLFQPAYGSINLFRNETDNQKIGYL